MKITKTANRLYQRGTAALVSVMLISCSSVPHQPVASDITTSQYSRIVYVDSPTDQLTHHLMKISETLPGVRFTTQPNFSEFRLTLTQDVTAARTEQATPRLFGKLYTDQSEVSHRISYTLNHFTRGTLHSESREVSLAAQPVVYPKLTATIHVDAAQQTKLLQEILPSLKQAIHDQPWTGRIVAQKDPLHVVMLGGNVDGFIPGDRFITDQLPIAELELSMFDGPDTSVLRLVSGPLPTTSQTLSPAPSQ